MPGTCCRPTAAAVGVLLVEVPQAPGDDAAQQGGRRRKDHFTFYRLLPGAGEVFEGEGRRGHLAGQLAYAFAFFGEYIGPRAAVDQLQVQRSFEGSDPPSDGGVVD